MRILLLFLLTSLSAFANGFDVVETLPRLTGGCVVVIVHNHSSYGATLTLNSGSGTYQIAPGTEVTCFVPEGWSGYLTCFSSSAGVRDYNGDADSSKPMIRHFWIANGPSSETVWIYGVGSVNYNSPYDLFTIGALAGVTIALSIAGLRVWRRSVAVSMGSNS